MKLSPPRPRSSLAVAAVLVVVVAGCGKSSDSGSGQPATGSTTTAAPTTGSQPAPSGSAAGATSMVDIKNFAFNPNTLTVAPGATVTWKFDDSTDHTVVADDNSFSSQPEGNGQTYSHTFPTAGTLSYHCSIHPFMKASITVK